MIDFLTKVFREELERAVRKERDEKEFLNQVYFVDCRDRANSGINFATRLVKKCAAWFVAKHRVEEHGDGREELELIEGEIPAETLEEMKAVADYWLM